MNHIMSISNVQNLTLMAHSIATRNMLFGLEYDPEYYGKYLNYLVLLAPFTESHTVEPINYFAMMSNILVDDYAPSWLHIYRSFASPSIISESMKWQCGYLPKACDWIARGMSHSTSEYNDPEIEKVVMSKYPG